MLKYQKGNLLNAPVEALINTVNTVGVMGKGIALQFKEQFPENYKAYSKAVKEGLVQTGKMFVVRVHHPGHPHLKFIINFPTKEHWRNPSQYQYIEQGLQDLISVIKEHNIKSVALPPLGAGNGKLDWAVVKLMIEAALAQTPTEVLLYEPSDEIKSILIKEQKLKQVALTPARGMLLYLLHHYTALFEPISEFAGEKLAYFLTRFGEKSLKLDFQKGHYGPYSGGVRHILSTLNGAFIFGYEQHQVGPFDPLGLHLAMYGEVEAYIKEKITQEQRIRLNRVVDFLQGYETAYSLELLATVDYIIKDLDTQDPEVIAQHVHEWSKRKSALFKIEHIQQGLKHLLAYKEFLYPATLFNQGNQIQA